MGLQKHKTYLMLSKETLYLEANSVERVKRWLRRIKLGYVNKLLFLPQTVFFSKAKRQIKVLFHLYSYTPWI